VLREARLLSAVAGADVRTPPVLLACDDGSVIGATFYVMAKVAGTVMTTEVAPELDTEAQRARIAEELVDALVEVHAVPWAQRGLEGYGKPTGYLERQLRRFSGLWEHNRTRELAVLDRVTAWLGEHLPESGPATIVHGDYRLVNTMYAPGAPARLVAIFDWELATIGDPLADLGYLTATYVEPGDEGTLASLGAVTTRPGFPTRELAHRPLRGAFGPLHVRRGLVPDAGPVEVGDLPRGLLPAAAGRHHRRPLLRDARAGRARDRPARLGSRAGRTGRVSG